MGARYSFISEQQIKASPSSLSKGDSSNRSQLGLSASLCGFERNLLTIAAFGLDVVLLVGFEAHEMFKFRVNVEGDIVVVARLPSVITKWRCHGCHSHEPSEHEPTRLR